jgi:phage terminase small subunit
MSLLMLLGFNKLYCVLYNKYKESLYLEKEEGAIISKYST